MKRINILLLLITICYNLINSQTQVPSNDTNSPIWYKDGKVGIGIMNPSTSLEISGALRLNNYIVSTRSGGAFAIYTERSEDTRGGSQIHMSPSYTKHEIVIRSYSQDGSGYKDLIWNNLGRLSIGAGWNPAEALDVNGNIKTNRLYLKAGNGIYSLYNNNHILNDHANGNVTISAAGGNLYLGYQNTGKLLLRKGLYDTNGSNLILHMNGYIFQDKANVNNYFAGNVGIGISNPTEKLSVDGTILAKEVRVSTDASDWPDFVFSDDYSLRSLEEIESFIKANKHLPDIPSAKEMEEEGVNLAEMNKLLLLKVEELTLFAIEKEKEVNALKENQECESKMRIALEERLAKIESIINKTKE